LDIEYTHTIKFRFLDASVIVKLVIEEPGSEMVKGILGEGTCRTTQYCIYEAYGVIKRKWEKEEIDNQKYFKAMYLLSAFIRNKQIRIVDVFLEDISDFKEAKRIVEQSTNKNGKCLIDLSDALQIISMKKGFYSLLEGESKPVLITADNDLGEVAKKEGLSVEVVKG
jgi:predicted nucleic acid-binding protein